MKTLAKLWISMLLLGTISCTLPNLSPGGGGLDVKLEMAKAPALNEPVVVTTTVTAVQDTAARVYLNFFSARVEIVNGPTEWQGTLKKGAPVQFSTTLRFVEEREHIVDALASGTAGMHGGAGIRVYVTRTGGTFTIPVPTPGPRALPTQPTPTSKIVPVSIYHQRSALLRLDIPDTGEWIAATADITDAPAHGCRRRLASQFAFCRQDTGKI